MRVALKMQKMWGASLWHARLVNSGQKLRGTVRKAPVMFGAVVAVAVIVLFLLHCALLYYSPEMRF